MRKGVAMAVEDGPKGAVGGDKDEMPVRLLGPKIRGSRGIRNELLARGGVSAWAIICRFAERFGGVGRGRQSENE